MRDHTLSQRRSNHALAAVEGAQEGEARTLCESLPGLIRVNGLLPVVLKCEKEVEAKTKGYAAVYGALRDWLMRSPDFPLEWAKACKDLPLAKRLTLVDSAFYLAVSEESLEYLGWLKRWYQAMVEKASGSGKGA